ncbi:MAG: FtsQ-type POTRA domain-containing protein [Clostridia bacterium]|nr:FtsQ-type POTRA domain-containing protein [Clostridia bacterium]
MNKLSEFETKKKQLVKKKKRNRAKRRLILFLFLFICIGTIFTILKAPFFNVKTIICVGQETISEEEIIKIAGAKTDVNIFSIGVGTMKRRLNGNPGIAECNVRRLFPNKIKIWVRESKAVVCVENGGVFLLADKNGQIIKVVDSKDKDAVKCVAKLNDFEPFSTKIGEYINKKDDSAHKVIFECIGILERLDMINDVTLISASDLSDIRIDYQDRLYIMLGNYEKIDYKLTFVKKVIDENLSKYEKAILDYRGNSLYVGPRTEEEQTAVQEGEKPEGEKTEENTENSTEADEDKKKSSEE